MLNEPDTNACDVVFQIPQSVLDALMFRRATQVLKHTQPVQAVSTLDLAVAAVSGTADSETVLAAVNFMNSLQSEVEIGFDAFLLDPGMGPMQYLTRDGRILLDYRTWDGTGIRFEQDLHRAICTIVCGTRKTGIMSLLELIPPLLNPVVCKYCNGTRWCQLQHGEIVCPGCSGRGEVEQDSKSVAS
jgi:hypothetical protein